MDTDVRIYYGENLGFAGLQNPQTAPEVLGDMLAG